jgi:dGTPase
MTHTLEVAQVARTIGRALRLNEDLIEAVALAHDVGTPPFGPAGERALDDALSGRLDGRGGPGLGDVGGFERPRQSLRVVDVLEKRYDHPGLNLTDVIREGILKSAGGGPADERDDDGLRPGLAAWLEIQVVALADRIAAALSDLDDALQSGTVDVGRVERLRAVAALRRKLGRHYPPRAGRFMKAAAIHRGLTHLLVTGAIVRSAERLDAWSRDHAVDRAERFAASADEILAGDEIGLPPAAAELLGELESFVESRVRRGQAPDRVHARGRRVLLGLLAAYHRDPLLLDDHVLLRWKQISGGRFLRDLDRADVEGAVREMIRDPRYVRAVADHLAAMTDAYAIEEHGRLLEAGAVPLPSVEQLRREDDR